MVIQQVQYNTVLIIWRRTRSPTICRSFWWTATAWRPPPQATSTQSAFQQLHNTAMAVDWRLAVPSWIFCRRTATVRFTATKASSSWKVMTRFFKALAARTILPRDLFSCVLTWLTRHFSYSQKPATQAVFMSCNRRPPSSCLSPRTST